MSYIIMRSPCLPEDEGRHFYVCSFKTKEKAEKWIKDQKEEYFKPGDYYIVDISV